MLIARTGSAVDCPDASCHHLPAIAAGFLGCAVRGPSDCAAVVAQVVCLSDCHTDPAQRPYARPGLRTPKSSWSA